MHVVLQNAVRRYPETPLTANSMSGYVANTSGVDGFDNSPPYAVFDWERESTWTGPWQGPPDRYSGANGAYIWNTSTTVDGMDVKGEWAQLQLPFPVILTSYNLSGRTGNQYVTENRNPNSWALVGSNDGIVWSMVSRTNPILWVWPPTGDIETLVANAASYSYYRFIILAMGNPGTRDHAPTVGELALFGRRSI